MCRHLPDDVKEIIEFADKIAFVTKQREVNFLQTVGLVKRILLYCIKLVTSHLEAEEEFDWSKMLMLGIQDLLEENNLDRLSVDGSSFFPAMKKTLSCLTKMITFYEEAQMGTEKNFALLGEGQIRYIRTLIKKRSTSLDRQEKERQTAMTVENIFNEKEKLPPMEEAFNAADQPAVQKIYEDIIRVGRTIQDGSVTCARKRAAHSLRDLNYKTRLAQKRKREAAGVTEEEKMDAEEEDSHQAAIETEESGIHVAHKSTTVSARSCLRNLQ